RGTVAGRSDRRTRAALGGALPRALWHNNVCMSYTHTRTDIMRHYRRGDTCMLKAAIVGATGIVGQQFVLALQQHPWFRIESLAASRRSAGRTYGAALRDPATGALRWYAGPLPDKTIFDLPVEDAETLEASRFDVIFTGVESDAAKALEPQYAKSCPV